MSTHIVQFGKHHFICGLFWQSLSRPRELRKEAVELARKINLDLMVIRKEHGSAQAGYAHTADGAQSGMLSLAAAVAQKVASKASFTDGRQQGTSNWLAAFKLPDGKWAYFAVRDDSFLPNGDFAGTRDEVLERLHGDYGLGGWNFIVGDKELENYGFHNFFPEQIDNLIPKSKSGRIKAQGWWALSPVDRTIPWKTLALAGTVTAVVAAAGGGYWMYHQKKVEEERQRALEEARMKLAASVPHPWPAKPMPTVLVQACLEKFTQMSPGGWALDEYVCDAGQIGYKWSRGHSTVAYLLEHVPNAVVELSGDKASYWEPMKLAPSRDEKLVEAKALLMPLLSRFQQLGLTLSVASVPPPPPPASNMPGTLGNVPPKPDWQTFTAKVNAAGVPPSEIATVLTQPGVRLDKLSYRSGEWLIEGVIYAK